MANVTAQQLAEILIGIARTQQAIVEGMESLKAGFKTTHFAPALDNTAKIRVTTRPLTLQEFPARVLMQCMGRAGPNLEQITRDLEALLSAPGAGGAAADAGSLDMTKTT
ncbi:MAG TPA: hypothetical protein VKD25_06760 [Burkholderiales bacterium]|nr:hypothetical protein [Burkholderiales bacterium]